MGLFEMIVAIVVITSGAEIVKALINRSGRSLSKETEERIRRLEEALRDNQTRLAHSDDRIEDLTEKLDFVEDLLSSPRDTDRLSAPRG